MLCILGASVIGGVNLFLLIGARGKVSWRNFLPAYWISWAWGLVVPGQVGDIAGISLLLRQHQIALHESLSRSILDKSISLLVMLLFALAGLSAIGWGPGKINLPSPRDVLILSGILLLMSVAWKRFLGEYFRARAPALARLVSRLCSEIRTTGRDNRGRLVVNAALSVLKVSLIGTAYWLVFRAAGQTQLQPLPVIGLAAASSVVAYLPISFNGLGTVEITAISLFSRLGASGAVTLSVYLSLRLMVLLLAWLPAVLWMLTRSKQE